MMSAWYERRTDGVLLDITGVLYESGTGGGTPIPGSIEAVKRLKASGIPVRFCTNETTTTCRKLTEKLRKLGFELDENEIFAPIPAVCSILQQRGLRPHLLVHPDCVPDFEGVDTSNPNCVVISDATHEFSYENMNRAFQLLMTLDNPILFSLGAGKFYKEDDKLVLDVGAYMKALEYSTDVKAEIVGKPSPAFFNTAVHDMEVLPDRAVMVGDDIVNDVGGAQACGMRGVQVRTGKYRQLDENHPTVKPDGYVKNLAEAVDLILCKK
ncbi:hypothetical protein ACJMK2_006598 [Sinanodonta woodiana]|uniref:Phospholysine phosphohistidine inorganic pyrophosphate phosphatase n=1 Tax=Sinanodonta woodiana TaxID=1069815 RepID=A0ABD3VTQ8_SINWO